MRDVDAHLVAVAAKRPCKSPRTEQHRPLELHSNARALAQFEVASTARRADYRSGDDAVADEHRFAAQTRVERLLDGGEEGVYVHVDDFGGEDTRLIRWSAGNTRGAAHSASSGQASSAPTTAGVCGGQGRRSKRKSTVPFLMSRRRCTFAGDAPAGKTVLNS
jgi:hypothetical protein